MTRQHTSAHYKKKVQTKENDPNCPIDKRLKGCNTTFLQLCSIWRNFVPRPSICVSKAGVSFTSEYCTHISNKKRRAIFFWFKPRSLSMSWHKRDPMWIMYWHHYKRSLVWLIMSSYTRQHTRRSKTHNAPRTVVFSPRIILYIIDIAFNKYCVFWQLHISVCWVGMYCTREHQVFARLIISSCPYWILGLYG